MSEFITSDVLVALTNGLEKLQEATVKGVTIQGRFKMDAYDLGGDAHTFSVEWNDDVEDYVVINFGIAPEPVPGPSLAERAKFNHPADKHAVFTAAKGTWIG